MNYIKSIAFALLLIPSVLIAQQKTATDFAETITADELQEMLTTFSSDEFEGRNTG